ncbi:MAG: SDR family oxidoreductase [Candidatus Omnitrophica bacterium]|nr:SDR family oxidoreductase [Candidatus Omnitrophota bacterium]
MRILVTGPLGHIGSLFIRQIPSGVIDDVVLVDNMLTQRYCSLFDLPAQVRYRFIEADVLKVDWDVLLKGVHAVIHFAAITDAAGSFGKVDEVESVNFIGTQRLAKACATHKVRLFFPSTTSVYGTQDGLVDESCSQEQLKPQSPYADSKLKAEEFLQELGRSEGLRFVVARFGTITGVAPGMRFHTAVNKFCWQAVMGQPLTVWRTALHQKRPYLTMTDAVRAVLFMMEKDLFDGKIYNVVTSNLTVDGIVQMIRTSIEDVRVELVDTRIMNQLSYEVSGQRLMDAGFKYNGDIAADVQGTIKLLARAGGRHVS